MHCLKCLHCLECSKAVYLFKFKRWIMKNQNNNENAQKLASVFQQFTDSFSHVTKETSFDNIADMSASNETSAFQVYTQDNTLNEEYDDEFSFEIKSFIKKPINVKNIRESLRKTRKYELQIKRIIGKIETQIEKFESLEDLYFNLEHSKLELAKYIGKRLIHPRLLRDKFYNELKGAIDFTERELKDKHNVKNREDIMKYDNLALNKKQKIRSLKVLLSKNIGMRKMLLLALRKLTRKIKGNISSKHPELQQFIDLLSCEGAMNLKTLKEKYGFVPRDTKDFTKEIKNCKMQININKFSKSLMKAKIVLLESVSTELFKNISHKKFLNREHQRQQNQGLNYREKGHEF